MAQHRHYSGDAGTWEAKFSRVITRMKATDPQWNFDRHGAWIRFTLAGQPYRLEQTVAQAARRHVVLYNGVDCFAQLVLTLEDLARMSERGIYELPVFMAGFKALPAPRPLAEPFVRLQFTVAPTTVDKVRSRYRQLARTLHPDAGGDPEAFRLLREAAQAAEALVLAGKTPDG